MSSNKPLSKMLKNELVAKVVELQNTNRVLDSQLAQSRRDVDRYRAEVQAMRKPAPHVGENITEKAIRYCAVHGVKAVSKETLLAWRG